MAHVQVPSDIRRGQRDRERLTRRLGVGAIVALGLPGLLPAFLDALGVVERVHHSPTPTFRRRSRKWMWSGSDYASSIRRALPAATTLPFCSKSSSACA